MPKLEYSRGRAAGGYESLHYTTDFAVDGLEGEAGMAVVQLLGSLLRQELRNVGSEMANTEA